MLKFYYLIALIILSSCHQETFDLIEEEPEAKKSNSFSFVDIEYTVNRASYTKDIIKELYPITITNNTGITQTYTFNPQKNISEKSTFSSRDTRAFSFVNDQQKIKVPITMSNDSVFTYDSGTRWTYSENTSKLEPNVNAQNVITIEPNQKMTLIATFSLREIVTGYRLHLKGNEFGEEVYINGEWSGVYFLDYNIDCTVEPI